MDREQHSETDVIIKCILPTIDQVGWGSATQLLQGVSEAEVTRLYLADSVIEKAIG